MLSDQIVALTRRADEADDHAKAKHAELLKAQHADKAEILRAQRADKAEIMSAQEANRKVQEGHNETQG